MSGLAAVFHRDGRPVNGDSVWDMLNAISFRGPDGMWTRSCGTVALGVAKLSVTPEELGERQPLVNPSSGCAIIADVRLDNRAEIFARLSDRIPGTASDAELILQCYETWGIDAFAQLLGDFAVVIWDPREERIVCARDATAQRPLFYRMNAETFAAASEIHQLFQDPSISIEPNHDRIRDFLVPMNMFRNEKDEASTFYEGIWSVPAAHVIIVTRDSHTIQRYWEFDHSNDIRYRRETEYADHFRELFFDAVRARLRSTYPVGALLSGGLDSSSVVCTAQELFRSGQATDHGFTSYSHVFDDMECDESLLIEAQAAKYGFPTLQFRPASTIEWLQLEPSGFAESPNALLNLRDEAYDAAVSNGTRVLLTGEIADSCVSGFPFVFDSLLRRGHPIEAWRQLKLYQKYSAASLQRMVAMNVVAPLLPLTIQKRIMVAETNRSFARRRHTLLPSWLPVELRSDLEERHLSLVLEKERGRRFSSPARHAEAALLMPPEKKYLPRGRPLEVWRPFADRRMQSYLLAVPPEAKFRPHPEVNEYYAGAKQILREAMRGVLPEVVRTRTQKTHFGSVFQDEVQRQWPLYEDVFGRTSASRVEAYGYIERERFVSRLDMLRSGQRGPDLLYLLRLVGLESWLRTLPLYRRSLSEQQIDRAHRTFADHAVAD